MTPPTDDTVALLFKSHAPALLLYASQWLDESAAEDAVQRVFVRMLAESEEEDQRAERYGAV